MTCPPTAVDCVRVSQVLVRKASRWVIATVAGRVELPELPTSPYSRPRARPLSSAQGQVRTAIGRVSLLGYLAPVAPSLSLTGLYLVFDWLILQPLLTIFPSPCRVQAWTVFFGSRGSLNGPLRAVLRS
jgi:hypothetical protein